MWLEDKGDRVWSSPDSHSVLAQMPRVTNDRNGLFGLTAWERPPHQVGFLPPVPQWFGPSTWNNNSPAYGSTSNISKPDIYSMAWAQGVHSAEDERLDGGPTADDEVRSLEATSLFGQKHSREGASDGHQKEPFKEEGGSDLEEGEIEDGSVGGDAVAELHKGEQASGRLGSPHNQHLSQLPLLPPPRSSEDQVPGRFQYRDSIKEERRGRKRPLSLRKDSLGGGKRSGLHERPARSRSPLERSSISHRQMYTEKAKPFLSAKAEAPETRAPAGEATELHSEWQLERKLDTAESLAKQCSVKDAQRSVAAVCERLYKAIEILDSAVETDGGPQHLAQPSREVSAIIRQVFGGLQSSFAVTHTAMGRAQQDDNLGVLSRLLDFADKRSKGFFSRKQAAEVHNMLLRCEAARRRQLPSGSTRAQGETQNAVVSVRNELSQEKYYMEVASSMESGKDAATLRDGNENSREAGNRASAEDARCAPSGLLDNQDPDQAAGGSCQGTQGGDAAALVAAAMDYARGRRPLESVINPEMLDSTSNIPGQPPPNPPPLYSWNWTDQMQPGYGQYSSAEPFAKPSPILAYVDQSMLTPVNDVQSAPTEQEPAPPGQVAALGPISISAQGGGEAHPLAGRPWRADPQAYPIDSSGQTRPSVMVASGIEPTPPGVSTESKPNAPANGNRWGNPQRLEPPNYSLLVMPRHPGFGGGEAEVWEDVSPPGVGQLPLSPKPSPSPRWAPYPGHEGSITPAEYGSYLTAGSLQRLGSPTPQEERGVDGPLKRTGSLAQRDQTQDQRTEMSAHSKASSYLPPGMSDGRHSQAEASACDTNSSIPGSSPPTGALSVKSRDPRRSRDSWLASQNTPAGQNASPADTGGGPQVPARPDGVLSVNFHEKGPMQPRDPRRMRLTQARLEGPAIMEGLSPEQPAGAFPTQELPGADNANIWTSSSLEIPGTMLSSSKDADEVEAISMMALKVVGACEDDPDVVELVEAPQSSPNLGLQNGGQATLEPGCLKIEEVVFGESRLEQVLDGLEKSERDAVLKERQRRLEEHDAMVTAGKLCLVLDLDHTLLNSAKFGEVDPNWDRFLRAAEAEEKERLAQDGSSATRELHRFPHMGMWTKLRPGVWQFLNRASQLFELHVYTMGNKTYATEMARLLDPSGKLFSGRVISKGDNGGPLPEGARMGEVRTLTRSKDLDGVLGMESAVLVVDDSASVWPHHARNLLVVERYTYFPSSRRQLGLSGPALLELSRDEREADGMLSSTLQVLERVHAAFFADPQLAPHCDVRDILAAEKARILAGLRIVFSRIFPVEESHPHLHPLWRMAEQFGASCTLTIDKDVTHVVAISLGTDKVNWALSAGKFVVRPAWLEASAILYRRANERDFQVHA